MTDYVDTYIASQDKDALDEFLRNFVNVIQPQRGPQVADGSYVNWYACVRATCSVAAMVSTPIEVVDREAGVAVVGAFAHDLVYAPPENA